MTRANLRLPVIFRILHDFRLLAVLVLVSAPLVPAAAACKSSPETRDEEAEESGAEPIRETRGERSSEFDEAVEALEAGEWERAQEAFQLLQTELGEGPEAQLAELYAARAKVGPLEPDEGGAEGSSPDGKSEASDSRADRRALQLLASLARSDAVDERVRRAAAVYRALVELKRGRPEPAFSSLADFAGDRIGPSVLDRDRRAAWTVLVEGFVRGDRPEDAIRAAASAYREIAEPPGDGEAPGMEETGEDSRSGEGERTSTGQSSQQNDRSAAGPSEPSETRARTSDPSNPLERRSVDPFEVPDGAGDDVDFLVDRAFRASSKASVEWAAEHLDADSTFLRAFAAWRFLDGRLEQSNLSKSERQRVEKVYRRAAVDLARIGAASRVEELSVRMATVGGAARLAIGVLVPLSGGNAGVGGRALSGAMMAARAFEARVAARVTVVVKDATRSPDAVMAEFDDHGVAAVVGPLGVDRANKFAVRAAERQLPMISLTPRPATPDASGEGRWVFRNFMDPLTEARAVADVAADQLGDRRAVVLYPSIGYGRRVQKAFAETFRDRGGDVVAAVAYDRTKSDFSGPASRVADANPDCVFIADSAGKVAELTAFLANENVWGAPPERREGERDGGGVHYLGTSLWRDRVLIDQAKKYVEGAVVPAWYAPQFEDRPTRTFTRRFRAVYERTPANIEAFAFDTVEWLRALMLERGIHGRAELRDALLGDSRHDGSTGRVWFDETGEPKRRFRFLTVDAEGFAPLELENEVDVRPPEEGAPKSGGGQPGGSAMPGTSDDGNSDASQ